MYYLNVPRYHGNRDLTAVISEPIHTTPRPPPPPVCLHQGLRDITSTELPEVSPRHVLALVRDSLLAGVLERHLRPLQYTCKDRDVVLQVLRDFTHGSIGGQLVERDKHRHGFLRKTVQSGRQSTKLFSYIEHL